MSIPVAPLPRPGTVSHSHRNFNVVKLARAKIIANIQKRTMTVGSFQPESSK
jgi:hypothetical protein